MLLYFEAGQELKQDKHRPLRPCCSVVNGVSFGRCEISALLLSHQQHELKQRGFLWSPGCLSHCITERNQKVLLPGPTFLLQCVHVNAKLYDFLDINNPVCKIWSPILKEGFLDFLLLCCMYTLLLLHQCKNHKPRQILHTFNCLNWTDNYPQVFTFHNCSAS